jgi:hypothetical protein
MKSMKMFTMNYGLVFTFAMFISVISRKGNANNSETEEIS